MEEHQQRSARKSTTSKRRKSTPIHEEDGGGSRGSTVKRSNGGFTQPVLLSYDLAEFMGQRVVPRTEVTKAIWTYIKQHNLQNPEKKSEILCDIKLEKLFKRKKLQMFKMTKFLSAVSESCSVFSMLT